MPINSLGFINFIHDFIDKLMSGMDMDWINEQLLVFLIQILISKYSQIYGFIKYSSSSLFSKSKKITVAFGSETNYREFIARLSWVCLLVLSCFAIMYQ